MSFSIVFIGDVDSGKSTLIKNLLYPNQSIEKIAQLTKLKKSGQIDGPITPSYKLLKQNNLNVTIIDIKGHRKFIKNAVTGISQADYAVLVTSANLDQFHQGFSHGVIHDHILIAYTFGIRKLIVCINKMDNSQVEYQEKCFERVNLELQSYIIKVGFHFGNFEFIPTSAINEENIFKKSDKMQWYKGPTLIQAINKLQIPKDFFVKIPLRISITNHYKKEGGGLVVLGKVQSGVVTNKTKLITAQGSHKSETKSIQIFHESVNEGKAGDIVGLNVALNKNEVKRGFVIGDEQNEPPKQVQCFVARISVLTNHRIKNGYIPIVDCGTAHVACKIQKIRSKMDMKTINLVVNFPNQIQKGDNAIIQMKPLKPFYCEVFLNFPQLGRIVLRDGNTVVAVGVINQVKHKQ